MFIPRIHSQLDQCQPREADIILLSIHSYIRGPSRAVAHVYHIRNPNLTHYLLTCPCVQLTAQVTKATWHMWHYGAPTPKPRWAFANATAICQLYKGPLRSWQEYCKTHPNRVRTSHRYVDSRGVKRFHGNKNLKPTEHGPQKHSPVSTCC